MVTKELTIWDLKHEAYCSRIEYGRAETILLAKYRSYQVFLFAQSDAIGDLAPDIWGITLRVCESDMSKVGYIKGRMRITKRGKKSLYIESLSVSSECRREGIASYLLKMMFLLADLCGVDYICGEFCPRSELRPEVVEKFYRDLGFQIDPNTNAMLHTEFKDFSVPASELLSPLPATLR